MTQQSVEDDKLREIVKPLVWRKAHEALDEAASGFGWYQVRPENDGTWWWEFRGHGVDARGLDLASKSEAKAACQADYTTRILSAIDTELLASREKLKALEQEREPVACVVTQYHRQAGRGLFHESRRLEFAPLPSYFHTEKWDEDRPMWHVQPLYAHPNPTPGGVTVPEEIAAERERQKAVEGEGDDV